MAAKYTDEGELYSDILSHLKHMYIGKSVVRFSKYGANKITIKDIEISLEVRYQGEDEYKRLGIMVKSENGNHYELNEIYFNQEDPVWKDGFYPAYSYVREQY